MDDFKDDIFENEQPTVGSESDAENEIEIENEITQDKIDELFSFSEAPQESPVEIDMPEEKEPDNVFHFTENGEYHFTFPQHEEAPSDSTEQPSGTQFNSETPQPQIENNNPIRQNPYRNPYHQPTQPQYNTQRSYSYQANMQQTNRYVEPEKPTNGSSAGKKVVAALLAVIIIVASVAIGVSIGQRNSSVPAVGESSTSVTNDSASLNVIPSQETPAEDINTVSPGIAVAKKARGSVVGVVVYDAAGTLYGEGSGVVMGLNDAKNMTYIITCAHVISDKGISSCGIMLSDGTIYPAEIVGYDERTDIGVLSVKQTNLEAASFGDSTSLQVGETVYAIGNPGGSEFYGSMTSGIVSALDRSISSTYTMTVIQHNAAISPGNSGGALVNSKGQVIGINSSKISATDYEGIGFAVPISVAQPVVENLIKYHYVPNRPKLGISYASVSNYWRYSAIVQSKGLPSGSVIIASISDDSSFKNTNVAVGDMITSVNGKKLDTADVLLDTIEKSKVGDELKLGICRIERSGSVGGSYKINQFEVTVKLVEDKGSAGSTDAPEETTTQSFYEYYYGNGNGDNYNNFDDFFSHFFGGN